VSLVDHGFRLPSAFDHRPLGFAELQLKLGWIDTEEAKRGEKRLKKG